MVAKPDWSQDGKYWQTGFTHYRHLATGQRMNPLKSGIGPSQQIEGWLVTGRSSNATAKST
jgi:hypothetical protein